MLLVLKTFSEMFDCESKPPAGINDPFPLSLDVTDPIFVGDFVLFVFKQWDIYNIWLLVNS